MFGRSYGRDTNFNDNITASNMDIVLCQGELTAAEWGLVASGATMIMMPVALFTFFIHQYQLTGLGGVRAYPQQHLTKWGST